MVSTLYRAHTLAGPIHCSCGIGVTRREEVDCPDRRVRLETLERRTAFRGTLVADVMRAAEVREIIRGRMRMRKGRGEKAPGTWLRIMAVIARRSYFEGE